MNHETNFVQMLNITLDDEIDLYLINHDDYKQTMSTKQIHVHEYKRNA
jgi:hypothetical protein